jgi:ribosomal protein S18 acetylase RimI-like enzyme
MRIKSELATKPLKIRRYVEQDFRAYVGTLEKTTSWGDEAEEELAARIGKMTEKDEIWVAEADAEAVGFMILTPNDDGTLEIDWLDVHPEFQRRKVATNLVARAAGVAKAKKVEALSVHTSVENKNMIAFLRRNGFEVFQRITDFYGKGKDALRYRKS